jgi:hypothetical protein
VHPIAFQLVACSLRVEGATRLRKNPCFATRDKKATEGWSEGSFPEEFEARNSHDPVILELGTTPVVPQIRKWLRGVDLFPSRSLSPCNLLILRWSGMHLGIH